MIKETLNVILQVLKGIVPENKGLLPDSRSKEEKAKDYLHEEVSTKSGVKVVWKEKWWDDFRKFPRRDQHSSMSCVAQSTAKALGVENYLEEGKFLEFSALDIYDRRSNKPGEGMIGNDALQIATKYGATLESLLKSQGLNEAQMNQLVFRTNEMVDIAEKYRAGGYVKFDEINIDKIAEVIEKGKAVILFMKFTYEEWQKIPKATAPITNIRHAVTAVDYTLYSGKKALVIEDSAFYRNSKEGQRIITEDFLKKRCYYAGYLLDLKNEDRNIQLDIPRGTIDRDLVYGEKSEYVKFWQDILKYEGFLNKNVDSTGWYHNLTAKATYEFQNAHVIGDLMDRVQLQGKNSRVGPATRKYVNEKYGGKR